MKVKRTRELRFVNRYDAWAMISSLLLFICCTGAIVCIFFLPFIRFRVKTLTFSVTAIDFIKAGISDITGRTPHVSADFTRFEVDFLKHYMADFWPHIAKYFSLITMILIIVAVVFLAIGALTGLICTCVGYIAGGYRAPKVVAKIAFVFTGIMGLVGVLSHTILQIHPAPSGIYIWAINSLFVPLVMLFCMIVNQLIYSLALKNAIFKKHMKKVLNKRNAEFAKRRSFGVNYDNNQNVAPMMIEDAVETKKSKKKAEKPTNYTGVEDYEYFVDKYGEKKHPEIVNKPSLQSEEKTDVIPNPKFYPDASKDIQKDSHSEEFIKNAINEKQEESKTTIKYNSKNGLPNGLTSLDSHQFSKNTALEVALIPEGIVEIGASCFANCINLKFVLIPNSVQEIKFNAFFNCASLDKINYGGTKLEWKNIKRGSNWLKDCKTKVVVCTDGSLLVDPLH